ncbi:hypothetical protein V1281_000300 [Nitrobacteraceae bacterium AZCC 2161]
MVSSVLFQPLLSALITLAAFFVMIWPGYALLHLLGHGRHRWPAALFAGPAVTLAIWIITLSGAAWASIPLQSLFGPIWMATLLLAIMGLALRISVNRRVAFLAEKAPREWLWLWAVAAALPLLIMPATLRYGLGDFVNSTYSDPWSYVMVADYLSAVARGTEGGLSAVHQYAAHLMNVRNASSAILAYLSFGLGNVAADQAMALFCLLLLFANVCALIGFARTVFGCARPALCLAVLAGLGWPANIVFAGNFDQLLLLPLLPLIAALAFRAGAGISLPRASALIGLLGAAALYAYVELAFLALLVAMAFFVAGGLRLRLLVSRTVVLCCIAVPIFLILTWPGLGALMAVLKGQYSATVGAERPGEGYFAGLLAVRRLPDSLWALGGEYGQTRWIVLPWLLGLLLCAVTVVGAWIERRRWLAVLASAGVAIVFLHFAFREHYSYAAYKILSVNFWLIGFFTVAGGIWLARQAPPKLAQHLPAAAAIAALLLATVADRTVVQTNVLAYKRNMVQQQAYREAQTIGAMVKDFPTLLSVRDDLANQWAVFYLSRISLLISPYRIYMAQVHVMPFMERARPVDPAAIRYIVTDRSDAIRAPVSGARRIWDGEAYSLWEINDAAWIVVTDVVNPNGMEPAGIWLGGGQADFVIVSGRAGPATFAATIQPGPRAAPGASRFEATVDDNNNVRKVEWPPGNIEFPVSLQAGRNRIGIRVDAPLSGASPANGDQRPMILRMMNYNVSRDIRPTG